MKVLKAISSIQKLEFRKQTEQNSQENTHVRCLNPSRTRKKRNILSKKTDYDHNIAPRFRSDDSKIELSETKDQRTRDENRNGSYTAKG